MSSWTTAPDPLLSDPSRGRRRPGGLNDSYVSQCKICLFGVYASQAWEWNPSRQPIGIVHCDCVPGGGG